MSVVSAHIQGAYSEVGRIACAMLDIHDGSLRETKYKSYLSRITSTGKPIIYDRHRYSVINYIPCIQYFLQVICNAVCSTTNTHTPLFIYFQFS